MRSFNLKSLLIFVLIVGVAFPSLAQTETSRKTHNAGVGLGFLSGNGAAYRHWFSSPHGYQVTFFPLISVAEERFNLDVSLGAMGLYSLHETRHTNFFGYYGTHYNGEYDDSDFYETAANTVYTGGGAGLEIHFWNINFSLMFGAAGRNEWRRNENRSPDPVGVQNDGTWNWTFEFQPSVEGGFFYSF